MRGLRVLDRVVVLLLGLALVAGGLLCLDYTYEVSGGYPASIDVGPVRDVTGSGWWPWAFAAAGLVVGLLALRWLLGHLRVRRSHDLRLSPSGPEGRLVVDLGSVADATADQLASLAPLTRTQGSVVRGRRVQVVELRARVTPEADLASLVDAVGTVADDVARAFPDEQVGIRLLLGAPRADRSRTRRRDSIRVR